MRVRVKVRVTPGLVLARLGSQKRGLAPSETCLVLDFEALSSVPGIEEQRLIISNSNG